jgi:hypothetical protein
MKPSVAAGLLIVSALCVPGAVCAQSANESLEESLGLKEPIEGTEIRLWLGGGLRVSSMYRVIRTDQGVSVERFVWAHVVSPAEGDLTAAEAKRETKSNRKYLAQERCSGAIMESADYLWRKCDVGKTTYWPQMFDDLLPAELWSLPEQGDLSCKAGADGQSLVVLDGEAITIEIIERERRHTVQYWNPYICCPTVGCALVDHVRQVVRNVE